MTSGKRASMREGPPGGAVPAHRGGTSRLPAPASRGAGEPDERQARRGAAARGAWSDDATREPTVAKARAPAGRRRRAGLNGAAHARRARRRPPPPSLPARDRRRRTAGATPRRHDAGVSAPASSNIPTPQERLRHAFSATFPEPDGAHRGAARHGLRGRAVTSGFCRAPIRSRTLPSRASTAAPRRVGTPVLRVVGVGGAGVNAVNRMIETEIEGIEFLAINTDLQSLQQSDAPTTLHIGDDITRGLGSGSNPDLGRQAAIEGSDKIKAALKGSDMVFITAGAGGGTGTGAAPIVARIATSWGR